MITKETIDSIFENYEIVALLFIKKDGTNRLMLATTKNINLGSRKPPKSVKRVLDLQYGEIRSFEYSNVLTIVGSNPYNSFLATSNR